MAAKKKKGQHVSDADRIRLGADVADYKAKTDAKTWKQIVADAHKRGLTVRSSIFDSGTPDALKERTKSSLLAEAEKNVADAYKPQDDMLNTQEQRAKALSAKRAQDNIAYRAWMDQQAATQQAAAAGAQQRYEQYLAQQQAAVAQPGQLQAQAQAAAQAGSSVSDMSQSTAVKGLSADEAKSQAAVAAARAQTAAMIPTTTMQQQNLALATRATFDAGEAKRRGDETNDLNNVFDARQKSAANRAADKLKEAARLLDNNTAIQQSNRDYAAAAEKLGLDSFKAKTDAKLKSDALKLKTKQFNLDTWIAQNKVSVDRAKIKLGYDQIKASKGKAAADRALKQYLGDQKHRDTVAGQKIQADANANKGSGTSQTQDQTVNTIYGQLVDLHKSHPNGTVSPAGRPIGFREYMRSKGYSDLQIDVAEDMRKHGGKLSPAGVAKAKRIGIKNPEQTIGVA